MICLHLLERDTAIGQCSGGQERAPAVLPSFLLGRAVSHAMRYIQPSVYCLDVWLRAKPVPRGHPPGPPRGQARPGGSDFDLDRLVALCRPCHAQTDALLRAGRAIGHRRTAAALHVRGGPTRQQVGDSVNGSRLCARAVYRPTRRPAEQRRERATYECRLRRPEQGRRAMTDREVEASSDFLWHFGSFTCRQIRVRRVEPRSRAT